MIISESFKVNNIDFLSTYSDISVYIKRIKDKGLEELYSAAEYPMSMSSDYRFEETDIKIIQ